MINKFLDNEMMNIPPRQPGAAAVSGLDVIMDDVIPYNTSTHKLEVLNHIYNIAGAELISEDTITIFTAVKNTCSNGPCENTVCANDWPTMQIRVTANCDAIPWCGEIWQPGDGDWRCVCPTAYANALGSSNVTSPTIWNFDGGHNWLFAGADGLLLQRAVGSSADTQFGARNDFLGASNRVRLFSGTKAVSSRKSWTLALINTLASDLTGADILGVAAPTRNAFGISVPFSGKHTDVDGNIFEWKKGTGWPV